MLMIYSAIFTLFLTPRFSAAIAVYIGNLTVGAPSTGNLSVGAPSTRNLIVGAPSTRNLSVGAPSTRNLIVGAPAIVYSAVIYNARRSRIRCTVFRSQPSGPTLTSTPITVGRKKYHLVKEVTYNMGTGTAAAIIQKIQCGNLVVNAPFANVTSPVKNWEFRVERNQIVSVGPSSYRTQHRIRHRIKHRIWHRIKHRTQWYTRRYTRQYTQQQ
ncbi:unnamed protein product [Rotaria magnacalcarata]|uniref:Uncharacterized protein n=1 Tax=Rotaria magnacalcarata TaxID=392030 RepID=A0A815UJB5_9BILA|nr:unnamed protein product [Rotaria magnacalcarata]CAF4993681.1 unnamed protein product [Rotaria magnacalcarata]